LHKSPALVTLNFEVKRVYYILFGIVLVALLYMAWVYRADLGLTSSHGNDSTADGSASARPARINWQEVNRAGDGFKVEMPEDPRIIQVSATNESGVAEPVNMIFSNPDGATTYAVAWADNPPVMRVANRAPDPTLDMARDGALARTQTQVTSESRINPQGFPGRDIVARNVGGGVLDSRLIYDGQRLYMLIACFPSMSARREQDVARFFNSFSVSEPAKIPETLPPALMTARPY
jgi:hypothetical protein